MIAANDNVPIRFLSVCSGIEAASVAFNPLGWEAIAFSEIEKFPSAVLAHHYPSAPNLGDFTKIDTTSLGRVDILCGGTPCQAFSVAGARRGLNDDRGNLTLSFVELAHELAGNGRTAGNGLRNVIYENVPGILSDKTNAFGCFLAGLVGADSPLVSTYKRGRWPNAGMVAGPKGRAAWAIKDAQFFGLAQRRKRVILVADFGNGSDPAAVLFEPESVRRDSPPSRETGQGVAAAVAPSLTASGRGVERTGDTRGQDPVVAVYRETGPGWWTEGLAGLRADPGGMPENVVVHAPEIARCDTTREGSSQDYESTTMVAIGVTGHISHALKAEGADGSEDGTGRGTPIVCFSAKDYGADASVDLAPTLRAGGHTTSHANAGVMPAIAFVQNSRDEVRLMNGDGQLVGALAAEPGAKQQCYVAQTVALRGRECGATAELGGDVATALRASSGGGDKPHVLSGGLPDIAGTMKACAGKTGGFSNSADHAAAGYMVPVTTSAVRRLTPRECERLQGFQFRVTADYPGAWLDDAGRWWSPDYTAIPYNKVSEAKLDADWVKYMARGNPKNLTRADVARLAADGPRYKALGNSWAVPLFTWLGERIQSHMPPIAANDNNKDIASAA